MRKIDTIIIHCSATKEGQEITLDTIRKWHLARGFNDIGYHFIIHLDGTVEAGRPVEKIGAHAAPRNTDSIGIVYIGGLDKSGKPKDTRTESQIKSLIDLIKILKVQFPIKDIIGHRDISPDKNGNGIIEPFEWLKSCPCFDVKSWVKENKL